MLHRTLLLLFARVVVSDFSCSVRELALTFASHILPRVNNNGVFDALQLSSCDKDAGPSSSLLRTHRRQIPKFEKDEYSIYVSPAGHDNSPGTISEPLLSLTAALSRTRAMASFGQPRTIVLREGVYYQSNSIVLSGDKDSNLRIVGFPGEEVVISGGVPMTLSFSATEDDENLFVAKIPEHVSHNFTGLLLNGKSRLPWARSPNGDVERDIQPQGWASCAGTSAPSFPPGGEETAVHRTVTNSSRNSTIYPYWGVDNDPRGGGTWFHIGGSGERFADNKTHWNSSNPTGLTYNETSSSFSTEFWTKEGVDGAIAHVYHNGLWGNWEFEVEDFDDQAHTLTFSRGGGQEARGGGIGSQPFYVEGVREALDAETEWWLNRGTRELFIYPNSTWDAFPFIEVVAPLLENILHLTEVENVTVTNIVFTHAASTFMNKYIVPSPGDWALHRGAAVELFGETAGRVAGVVLSNNTFVRNGGNDLILNGNVKNTTITDNDFSYAGDSAILLVGEVDMAFGTEEEGALYPENTQIVGNQIHDVGIFGKQSSALFVALSCGTVFTNNVLFNGPRAGININDGFCGGHNITRNLVFNFVRETQDHGPINTWNRAMYVTKDLMKSRAGKNGEENTTTIPAWSHISGNFVLNGPSGNRDLGNLFPTIDNDDGSSFYYISQNFLVFGGTKNYLGSDKIWTDNIIAYPGYWSGDPCLQAWGGLNNLYYNNTCYQNNTYAPLGLDGTVRGSKCVVDYDDQDNVKYLANTTRNSYFTSEASDILFPCHSSENADEDHLFSLSELQAHGYEVDTVIKDIDDVTDQDIIASARSLLFFEDNVK